jgi:hypothetical protein
MRVAPRSRRRRLPSLVGAALLVGLLVLPAGAQGMGTAQTTTAAEAWYQGAVVPEDAPFCILPCPQAALPTNPYPEGTLHVGVTGGREAARTYFTLDFSVLPTGAPLQGGTVVMPVAGADAGTTAVELADMVACLVRGTVEPTEAGQPEAAPEADCTTSSPLTPDDEHASFTVDLAPFADRYTGVGDLSLAVLPSEEAVEASETWRVAFNGSERESDDAEPITAEIRYGTAEEPAPPPPPAPPASSAESEPAPPAEPFVAEPPAPAPAEPFTPTTSGGGGFSDPPPSFADSEIDVVEEPQVVGEEEPAPAADEPTEAVLISDGGYAYPQVWLLPLALLGVSTLLVRSLSDDYEIELDDDPLGV